MPNSHPHPATSLAICAATALLTACALPPPETLLSPTPLQTNTGKFLNPYLADGKLAPWAERGVNTNRTGAAVSGFVAAEAVGFIDPTGFAANAASTAIKQQGAIDAAGGKPYMKSTSDTSFDRRQDVAIYLYVNHSTKQLYKKTLELMKELYPDLGSNYESDIHNAPKKTTTTPTKTPG